jgi:hypothetical protein
MSRTRLSSFLPIAVIVGSFTGPARGQIVLDPVQGPNGNIYQVLYEPSLTWGEAVRLAAEQRLGGIRGHLVTVNSFDEDQFVTELAQSIGVSGDLSVWLGGYQELNQASADAGWRWIDDDGAIPGTNRPSPYANWLPGFPNDGSTTERNNYQFLLLGAISGRAGWYDAHPRSGENTYGVIVEFEVEGGLTPDCNQNGVHDAIDLVTRVSSDDNDDGVPDECNISFRLVEAESQNCVRVVLTTLIPTRGGEIGLAYDPSAITPSCAQPGLDFPGGAGDIFCSLDPPIQCPSGVEAGFTVGWVNAGTGTLLAPGTYDLFRICFVRSAAGGGGPCSPLRFVDCLGVPEAPVQNTVSGEDNRRVAAVHTDGEVCPLGAILRRGDTNADGSFDISDAVFTLSCLFLGTACSTCPDAADSNDDGRVDVSDAAYLLRWRFLGGAAPPQPFPGCGVDATSDSLADCIFDTASCT